MYQSVKLLLLMELPRVSTVVPSIGGISSTLTMRTFHHAWLGGKVTQLSIVTQFPL